MKWKTGASEQLGDYFSQMVWCTNNTTRYLCSFKDFLTIYSEYINNYNDSLATYNELRKKTAFATMIQVHHSLILFVIEISIAI